MGARVTTATKSAGMPRPHRLELRRPASDSVTGALTIDVEDWFQSCVDFDAPITSRVVKNVELVLEALGDNGLKATFFVQGLVAEAFPSLVAELAADGHEIQSHAHTHRPLDRMSRNQLREELVRGKAAVEDAAGVAVTAFRAPDFTIGRDNLWALEELHDLGFRVDSSIFPLATARYGIAGWEPAPHRLELGAGRSITEVPVAVWEWRGRRIPVAGGGYVRLAPYPLLRHALRAVVSSGRPPVVYCHPYEFNRRELAEYRGRAPERFRLQQGIGRRAFVRRIKRLREELRLGRLDEVLAAWGAPTAA